MTSERYARSTLHPDEHADDRRLGICPCGQELDVCSGRHCPRCGRALRAYAA